jgi:hypothetical protein
MMTLDWMDFGATAALYTFPFLWTRAMLVVLGKILLVETDKI